MIMFGNNASAWTIAELKAKYGQHKNFTPETELAALLALSFYPELRNTPINFKYKEIKTTMAARPRAAMPLSRKRSYNIYINSQASLVGGVNYAELNLEQQLGIIAHELAHIVQYEQKDNLQLLLMGLRYKWSPDFKVKMERATDQLVIDHGLAGPLRAFSCYVLYESKASDSYKEFKRKNYMLPEEIHE
jgi:hypothetical protein